MKLLMTADAVGGVWRYSIDLIEGLAAEGVKVLLATMGPRPSDDQRQQVASIPGVTLMESDFALEWMAEPWRDVDAAGEWLLGIADEFGAEVIHLNGYAHAALPWQRPVVVVAHSCVYSWWRAVHACAPDAEWNEYRVRVAAGLAAATHVIAPSAAMAQAVAAEYSVELARIRVIHNFGDSGRLERLTKEPFFMAAGRVWDKAKNMAMLDGIARRLSWEMEICGPDSKRGMLPYSELLRRMSQASVFVHPSLYEPFGLSVLEAARRGCCLVLSDIPSLRELWQDAAVFVDPRRPEAWIEALNRLTQDKTQRRQFAECAERRAERYNAAVAIGQYQQAYRS